jgi:Zn-dependent protease
MQPKIVEYVLSFLAVLVILTVHEYSHGYAAYRLGDNTAKNFGRLSLNPLKHLDPIGTICLVVFGFGWARPVPVNLRNLKNPRRDSAIISLAGPLSNLILAFISAFNYLLIFSLLKDISFQNEFLLSLANNLLLFLYLFHSINVGIAIFNLIPIPPLDGSKLLFSFLPPKAYIAMLRNERKIYYVLIGWLLLGDMLKAGALSVPFIAQNRVLSFICGIFSLSDMLSYAIKWVSGLMLDFWMLIPFLKV